MNRLVTLLRYWRRLFGENPRKFVGDLIWLSRVFALRFVRPSFGYPISQIPTYYINLDRRVDRRRLFEDGFKDFKLSPPIRVSGVEHLDGMIGCSLAHKNALEMALENGAEITIMAEDDIALRCESSELHAVIDEFCGNRRLDVLCIGNRVKGFLFSISENLAVSNDIQTASLYVVKKHALPKLIRSAEESAEMLARGLPYSVAAPDIHWKRLQGRELVFAVPLRRCATQRHGFSDIAGREVAYEV